MSTEHEELMNALRILHSRLEEVETKVTAIDSAVNSYPAALKLYKGINGNNGALQLDLTPLHKSRRDIGAVFLSAAPAVGNNIYDWDQKINMALNLSDIAIVLDGFRSPPQGDEDISLYHDKFKGTEREGEVITKLSIKRGEEKGWRWSLGRKEGGAWRYVNVPISDGETVEIRTLLERAVARILAW